MATPNGRQFAHDPAPDPKKAKRTRITYLVLLIVFICIFLFCAFQIISYFAETWQIRRGGKDLDELLNLFPTLSPPSFYTPAPSAEDPNYSPGQQTPEPTEPPVFPSYEELLNINSDFVGWITVNNTEINYPIVQTTNNDYYLTHTFYKQSNRRGAIFMDYRNSSDLSDRNTIIYGHHPHDGTMFQDLTKFRDYDFWQENKYIYINSLNHQYIYEVFAVMPITDVNEFYYIYTDFASDEQFLSFIDECRQRSIYETDTVINADDKIVTLSTCSYETGYNGKGRLVLLCKQVGSD